MLETRKPLATGLYAVRLRATFQIDRGGKRQWIRKYYSTGVSATEAEFEKIMGKPGAQHLKDKRRDIDKFKAKADRILEKYEFVGPELFDRQFRGAGGGSGVSSMFDQYVEELQQYGQVGTAATYKTAINSFKAFYGSDFTFHEITTEWLRRYDKWMKTRVITKMVGGKEVIVSKGASVTTVAMYLRCLKKIFNDAIEQRIISADFYPFGKRKYTIQTVRNSKTALTEEQKDAVLSYKEPKNQKSVDFWIFSYFCNGMNFSDIARLRNRDLKDGVIYFDRAKTMRTNHVLNKIEIPVRAEVEKIIARYRNKSLKPDDYIFPILQPGMTAQQEKYRIQDFIDKVNKDLRRVASDLKFSFKFTTYTARHTFSNISLQKGASKEQIQEALGHQSIMTTEYYTAGFKLDTKKKMSAKL